jgi:hypothetical protein
MMTKRKGPSLSISNTTVVHPTYQVQINIFLSHEERCSNIVIPGMAIGGTLGFFEGLRKGRLLPNPTPKLRQNAIVNAMGKRGPVLAANLAVMALMFTGSERIAQFSRDKDDVLNSVIAASATGFMFNCASGPRKCLVYTALGGAGMGLVALTGHAHTVLHRGKVNPFTA